MDHYSQTYCGCGGNRPARNPSGPTGNRRFSRPLPECSCKNHDPARSTCADSNEFPIAMAYVPWQTFRNLYPYEKALCVGSIFQELDKPFVIGRCAR